MLVDGIAVAKPASRVGAGSAVEIEGGARFVSRAGYKLDAALDHFHLDVHGVSALDVGASAGGFTDCLLSRGAARVVAVDVGRGQFSPSLLRDDRVSLYEQTDIRAFVGERFPLIVVDLSFISLCSVAADLSRLLDDGGDLVALVKPQFEVGREAIGRGVVTDDAVRETALAAVRECLMGVGVDTVGEFDPHLRGEHGNQETFLWGKKET